MKYETVEGRSMAEVMAKVAAKYGEEAFIVHKHKVPWPLRMIKRNKVAVMVGYEPTTTESTPSKADEMRQKAAAIKQQLEQRKRVEQQNADEFRNKIEQLIAQKPTDQQVPMAQASAAKAAQVYGAVPSLALAEEKEEVIQPEFSTEMREQPAPKVPQSKEIMELVEKEIVARLGGKMDEILTEIRQNQGLKTYDEPFGTIYRHLIHCDMDWTLSQHIVERILRERPDMRSATLDQAWAATEKMLGQILGEAAPTIVRPDEKRIIALIGPTGVGKTTTIAKLAADFAVRQDRKVGLITADTYRIAAVEQLREYARIVNVPLEVVDSPSKVREAVRRLHECDLIIIDTAGRSPKNVEQMEELKELLDLTRPDELYLVVSATTRPREMIETYQRFQHVNPTKLIFTKLDEGTAFGGIVTLAAKSNLPIGYVTTGQRVPSDIVVPSPNTLVSQILGKVQVAEA